MAGRKICVVEGCSKPNASFGLCCAHRARLNRTGNLDEDRPVWTRGDIKKFYNKCISYDGDDCLIWPYKCYKSGYAKLNQKGKSSQVSRAMCTDAHGDPPTPEHESAHSCGKGHLGCINPRHLSWKTPKENQADRRLHGTYLAGDRISWSHLTNEQAKEIRMMKGAIKNKEMAEAYGVSISTIYSVLSNRTYKDA